MALLMVLSGASLAEGHWELASLGNVDSRARQATAWVEEVIAVVKTAPDSPYGEDDELIAGEILRQLEVKQRQYT